MAVRSEVKSYQQVVWSLIGILNICAIAVFYQTSAARLQHFFQTNPVNCIGNKPRFFMGLSGICRYPY